MIVGNEKYDECNNGRLLLNIVKVIIWPNDFPSIFSVSSRATKIAGYLSKLLFSFK